MERREGIRTYRGAAVVRSASLVVMLLGAVMAEAQTPGGLKFTVKMLMLDLNECCDVADVDRDGNGRLDIVAPGKSGTYILFNQGSR